MRRDSVRGRWDHCGEARQARRREGNLAESLGSAKNPLRIILAQNFSTIGLFRSFFGFGIDQPREPAPARWHGRDYPAAGVVDRHASMASSVCAPRITGISHGEFTGLATSLMVPAPGTGQRGLP